MKYLSLLFLSLLALASAKAELQPVTSWKQDEKGITVTLNPGTLRILVCKEGILRVQYAKEGEIHPLPDIIQPKQWAAAPFTVTEDAAKLTLKTKLVTATLGKADRTLIYSGEAITAKATHDVQLHP